MKKYLNVIAFQLTWMTPRIMYEVYIKCTKSLHSFYLIISEYPVYVVITTTSNIHDRPGSNCVRCSTRTKCRASKNLQFQLLFIAFRSNLLQVHGYMMPFGECWWFEQNLLIFFQCHYNPQWSSNCFTWCNMVMCSINSSVESWIMWDEVQRKKHNIPNPHLLYTVRHMALPFTHL